jgi:hypothetical protein
MNKRPETRLLRQDWDDAHGLPEEPEDPHVFALHEDREDLLAPRLALLSGWRFLRHESSLVGWVMLAELLGALIRMTPLFVMLLAWSTLTLRYEVDDLNGVLAWLLGTARWLLQPDTLVATVGMFSMAWLGSQVLGTLAQSGVLGALRRRILADQTIARGLFWKSLGERAVSLLVWEVTRGALLLAGAAIGAGLIWGTARHMVAWAPHGYWSQEGLWGGAVLLSLAFALGAGVVALLALICHLALGPLVLGGRSLGESFYESVWLLARRPTEVLSLYGLIALLYGVVWAVYLPFYLASVQMGEDPRLALASLALQLVCDTALWVGMAVVTVWTRAAVLSWVGIRQRAMNHIPAPVAQPREPASVPEVEVPQEAPQVLPPPPWGQVRSRQELDQVPLGLVETFLPQEEPTAVSFEALRRITRKE